MIGSLKASLGWEDPNTKSNAGLARGWVDFVLYALQMSGLLMRSAATQVLTRTGEQR